MGFMENMARKAESKAREKMFTAFTQLKAGMAWGGVALPCHIIEEVHNGIFLKRGEAVLVAFPCQGVWWGYQLTPQLLDSLCGPMAESLVFPMFGTLVQPQRLADYPGLGAVPTAAAFAYAVEQIEQESLDSGQLD